METFRYFMGLRFIGSGFCGWQIQKGQPSIQQTIEDALAILVKEKISLTGAGRTDTGVHALNYTAHFDCAITPDKIGALNLIYRLNRILPPTIAVNGLTHVSKDAHARFSAIGRTYNYLICRQKDPFWHDRAWILERELNIEAMREAAELLLNFQDFKCFSKSNTQVKNYFCKISEVSFREDGHILIFQITSDRFLRNMVRAIVGTLADIGMGKLDKEGFVKIIESRNRSNAGYSVPGHGLYFRGAKYEESIFLPSPCIYPSSTMLCG